MNVIDVVLYLPTLLNRRWRDFMLFLGIRVIEMAKVLRIESSQTLVVQDDDTFSIGIDKDNYLIEDNITGMIEEAVKIHDKDMVINNESVHSLSRDQYEDFVYLGSIPTELFQGIIASIITLITVIIGCLAYKIHCHISWVEDDTEEIMNDDEYSFEKIEREIMHYQEILARGTQLSSPNREEGTLDTYWYESPLDKLRIENSDTQSFSPDNLYENYKENDGKGIFSDHEVVNSKWMENRINLFRQPEIKNYREMCNIANMGASTMNISHKDINTAVTAVYMNVFHKTKRGYNANTSNSYRESTENMPSSIGFHNMIGNEEFCHNFFVQEIKCFPIEVRYSNRNRLFDSTVTNIFEEVTRYDLNTEFDRIQNSVGIVSTPEDDDIKIKDQINAINFKVNDRKKINKALKNKSKEKKKDNEVPGTKLTLRREIQELLINNTVKWQDFLYPNELRKVIKLKDLEYLVKDYSSSEAVGNSIIQVEVLQLLNASDNSIELINKMRFLLSIDFKFHDIIMREIVQNYRLWLGKYIIKLINLISSERLEFSQSLLLLIRDYLTYYNSIEISVSQYKEYLTNLVRLIGNNEALNNSISSCIISAIISLDYESLSKSFFAMFNEIFSGDSKLNQQVIFMRSIKYYICFNKSLIVLEFIENPNANKIKCCGYLLIQLFARNIDDGIQAIKKDISKRKHNSKKSKSALTNNPLMLELIELYLVFVEIFLFNDEVAPSIQYEILTNFITPIYSKLKNILEPSNCYLEPPILKELQVNILLT